MCFSIDQLASLENIPDKWLPEIEHFCPNVPFILVGNKTDLRNDPVTIQVREIEIKPSLKEFNTLRDFQRLRDNKRKPIEPIEGQMMASKINAYAYVECSAKSNEGVREVFEMATRAALKVSLPQRNKRFCVLL